jgi:putative nucleotidyltransferase with HDIG domain
LISAYAETNGSLSTFEPQPLCSISPVSPIASRLIHLMAQDDVELEELAEVLRADLSCSAELLALVNSPLYSRSSARVESVSRAVLLLGLERTRSLAMAVVMRSFVRKFGSAPGYRMVWEHSLASAILAEELAEVAGSPKDIAYTSALMHDIGRIGMLKTFGDRYEALLQHQHVNAGALEQIEAAEFGMSHSDAGAFLASSWGFPTLLQSCILNHHHQPESIENMACVLAQYAGFFAVQYRDEAPVEEWSSTLPAGIRNWVQRRLPGISRSIQERIDTF